MDAPGNAKDRPAKARILYPDAGTDICTGRNWCDFVSFDDRLPEDIAYFCTRIQRDDKFIGEMLEEVSIFPGEPPEKSTRST